MQAYKSTRFKYSLFWLSNLLEQIFNELATGIFCYLEVVHGLQAEPDMKHLSVVKIPVLDNRKPRILALLTDSHHFCSQVVKALYQPCNVRFILGHAVKLSLPVWAFHFGIDPV